MQREGLSREKGKSGKGKDARLSWLFLQATDHQSYGTFWKIWWDAAQISLLTERNGWAFIHGLLSSTGQGWPLAQTPPNPQAVPGWVLSGFCGHLHSIFRGALDRHCHIAAEQSFYLFILLILLSRAILKSIQNWSLDPCTFLPVMDPLSPIEYSRLQENEWKQALVPLPRYHSSDSWQHVARSRQGCRQDPN